MAFTAQKPQLLFLLNNHHKNVLAPILDSGSFHSQTHCHITTDFNQAHKHISGKGFQALILSGTPEQITPVMDFYSEHNELEPLPCLILVDLNTKQLPIEWFRLNIRKVLPIEKITASDLSAFFSDFIQIPVRSEKNVCGMLDRIPAVSFTCTYSPKRTMVSVSQLCKELTGYDQNELTESGSIVFGELIHIEDRDKVWQHTWYAFTNDQPLKLFYRISDKSGSIKWVYEQSAFSTENGQVFLHGFLSDVTELKQSETKSKLQFNQFQTALNHFSEIVYITDPDTNDIIFSNQKLKNILGYDPTGHKCHKAIFGLDKQCEFCIRKSHLARINYHSSDIRSDHLNRDFIKTQTLIHWPERQDVRMVLAVDITDRIKLENEKVELLIDLQERNKEKECLFSISNLLSSVAIETNVIESQSHKISSLISEGFFQPQFIHCRIQYVDMHFQNEGFKDSDKLISSDFIIRNHKVGQIDVSLDQRSSIDFLPEEQELLDEICKIISTHLEKYELTSALRISEKRANLAIKSAGLGVYEINMHTGDVIVNDEFAKMLGYEPESFTYCMNQWERDLHPDDYHYAKQMFQDFLSGVVSEYHNEFRLKTKSGKWKWILAVGDFVSFDSDGQPITFTGIHTDIDIMKTYSQNLEQQIRERTISLEMANKELESFSYSVSHDLRAPLRHINGFSKKLAEHAAAQLDEKSRHYIDIISESSSKMGQLIDELLRFSRTGRAEISPKHINPNDLVAEYIESIKTEIENRNIEFVLPAKLPEISGDPVLIKQVFVNLLSNAVKYTRKEELATVKIFCEDQDTDYVFAICDNGVGFDMAYKDMLFGVFQRLHHSSDFEGSGIGLANVRRIITKHGGKVWANSELNKGSTFYFTLPKHNSYEC